MSDKLKGDTSSASTLAQIKNNPLLSASVTGMLLDDFPNKPLLLPAAPPIVTTRPIPENPNNNKSSPSVTVGETPEIDTEQFSEINLNASSDGPIPFSLQPDINDNPFPQIQHDPPAHSPSEFADESILSQAASSFSQLPSVASTVLSTFSKVINNYTPTSQAASRETSSERDLIQNTQQQQQIGLDQYPRSDFLNNSPAQSSNFTTPQTDPPTFFTPYDHVNQPKQATTVPQLPPPLTVGTATGNTYRLTSKKKTYAQIPGLSKQLDQTIQENSFINQPKPSKSPNSIETSDYNRNIYPPHPSVSQQPTVQTEFTVSENNLGQNNYTIPQVTSFQQSQAENTTTKTNSLFSLSNIVPPVLHNLTGFVKSTVTGPTEQSPVQPQQLYKQDQSSINIFNSTAPQPTIPAAAGFSNPANYFVPVEENRAPIPSGQIGFESIQSSVKTPPLQTTPPKPPQAAGTSSFRLQKGTRLYKSPFEQSTAPSAPSIQAAFSLAPAVPQLHQQESDIRKPIPQTLPNSNPPPAVVTGLPPLPQSEGGKNFFAPISVTSFIDCSNKSELAHVPLFNPLNNQQSNSASYENKEEPITQILNPINPVSEEIQVFHPLNQLQNISVSTESQISTTAPTSNRIDQLQNNTISPPNLIPEITNFFNPINATSSFIDCSNKPELAHVPLFNPLNNQQSNSASYQNKEEPITQIFNPINPVSEAIQGVHPLKQLQNISVSTQSQIPETALTFNPIDQLQNNPLSAPNRISEITSFFNPLKQSEIPLVAPETKTDPRDIIQHQEISTITENQVAVPIQTGKHKTDLQTAIFNPVHGNATLFETDKLFSLPEIAANNVPPAAFLNPVKEIQSPANFFKSFAPQQSTADQSQFLNARYNLSQNSSSIPNFPPPPVERPELKEDQYDSVPLQPPSVDQKPIEPLIKNTSELPELQATVTKNQLPVGPTQPPITNQPGSNPFRRTSGLNNKLSNTVTPPTIFPSQFVENSQLSPVNFFNPEQIGVDNTISEEIIIANTIDFPTEEESGEIKSIQNNFNTNSNSIQENVKIQSSVEPISTLNVKQIDNLQKNTNDLIKNLESHKSISGKEEPGNIISQKDNFIKDSSSLSNYFGNVSESKELNNFSNIISSTSTEPLITNITSTGSETINKNSDFEKQLQNKFDNKDHIQQPYQSEDTVPCIGNFFNNKNPINHQLHFQSTISPAKSEENFNFSQKSTPEKLEKSQQNSFTNYFTSINQQQIQNIEKQSDISKSTNLAGNSQANLPKSDPSAFFDSFNNSANLFVRDELNCGDIQTVEDPNSQRIQNFFNNPPPQNLGDSINDLDYNIYESSNQDIVEIKEGLLTAINNNNEINRPLTPASNLVEPPSSACSEFSNEFNNSLGGQQQQILDNLKKLSTDELPEEILEQLNMAKIGPGNIANTSKHVYQPVTHHWFFKKSIDSKQVWTPFSHKDSKALETSMKKKEKGSKLIPVEGGRYDVDIKHKTRTPVYWNGDSSEVRRCSWFYKAIDSRYVPYDELTSDILEAEYKNASQCGEWHKKVALSTGETVVFHGPTVMVHFLQSQIVDAWGGATQSQSRPRVVKRDLDDFIIDVGETNKVDHVLFMVHGIGSGCDLKFRSVEEVVEEFRSIAYQLVQSHYKNSCDQGEVGRVEVLPVSWHDELHSKESGIDEKLKAITLESIPRLRNFANDTVLDVLFYTSPVFCQSIINTVANCMNRVYLKYCERNTNFNGQISLAGHSLGSLILFDLLCHQKPIKDSDIQNSENPDQILFATKTAEPMVLQKQVSYTIGSAGTGQPFINYPQLLFAPKKFFALGSPIGMFVTIRGIDSLGLDFKLPTCPSFYNIFHPYDPVAYRMEALINPELSAARPVLIPHHKGRKRMHLELKETMTRVGSEVKQKLVETFKNTVESVFFMAPKTTKSDVREIEEEVDKVLEMQLKLEESSARDRTESQSPNVISEPEAALIDLPLGKLNDSKRIDYVLQEAPLEFFNEYLFALTSHVCYWESADTILFVVKEIYSSLGITTDSQIPQQTMTIERPNSEEPQS